jgi:SPP1 family predicted phage head-tail adaptor
VSIAHLFNETAAVSRPGRTTDSQGGWTEDFVPVGSVRCRIRSWTSNEELIARQSGVRISHVMYCQAGANVRRGDRVAFRGVVADVRSVRLPSDPTHHAMIDLEERQT